MPPVFTLAAAFQIVSDATNKKTCHPTAISRRNTSVRTAAAGHTPSRSIERHSHFGPELFDKNIRIDRQAQGFVVRRAPRFKISR